MVEIAASGPEHWQAVAGVFRAATGSDGLDHSMALLARSVIAGLTPSTDRSEDG